MRRIQLLYCRKNILKVLEVNKLSFIPAVKEKSSQVSFSMISKKKISKEMQFKLNHCFISQSIHPSCIVTVCFFVKCFSNACRTSLKCCFFLPRYLWQSLQYAKCESSPIRTWIPCSFSRWSEMALFVPPRWHLQFSQYVILICSVWISGRRCSSSCTIN